MAAGPLDGLRVIELGECVPGPYCSKVLADLGAEVIKVEPLPGGDPGRSKGPFLPNESHPDASALFLYLNTNKYGVALNLEVSTGRELLHSLLDQADFLVANHLPKEIQQLGLDYANLRRAHPRLISVFITPFGQTGPYKDYVATDLISFHMGGFGYGCPGPVERPEEEPPLRGGGRQADFLAGAAGAAGALHAWFCREISGEGLLVDVSEQEVIASMMYGQVISYCVQKKVPGRKRGKQEQPATGRLYACKDGFFGANFGNERNWMDLLELMGNPEWAQGEVFKERNSRMGEARPHIEEWARQFPKAELHLMAQAKHVPVLPTNTVDEVVQSAHQKARGYFVEASHPSGSKVTVPGAPYKFSATPWSLRLPAPRLGEHTDKILVERLGMTEKEVSDLRAASVV